MSSTRAQSGRQALAGDRHERTSLSRDLARARVINLRRQNWLLKVVQWTKKAFYNRQRQML
ncbi:hypothetical protein J6590_077589 [Homalodisca vitripennis]|nr:hypothetical protein J6590_077589 [Homalodisca vitripennis]